MANYSALGALRKRLALVIPSYPSLDHPFTDLIWAETARMREATDRATCGNRFRVIWLPAERGAPTPRVYYFKGSHGEVLNRARALFAVGTVVVDSAPFDGNEVFDRRVNIIGEI